LIIEWLPDAEMDLEEIYDFIAEDDPDAADSQIRRIHGQVGNLTKKVSRKGINRTSIWDKGASYPQNTVHCSIPHSTRQVSNPQNTSLITAVA